VTDRPLRIAHVTATFPPYYGGTGNVCYHNARTLAARGHEVHVVTAAWPGEFDDPPGVTVHRLRPGLRVGNAVLLPGLVRALRGYDVIHLHLPFIGGGELTAAAARTQGTPLVVTYHNDLVAPGARGALFAVYRRTVAPLILASAERIAVVAEGYAAASPLLAPLVRSRSPRLVEIPNGVDTTRFHPDLDGAPIRRALGIPAEAFVVAFSGVLDAAHHFKRLDLLLRAVAAVELTRPWLLVVGGGHLLPFYQQLAADLGIANRVRFVGQLAHADVPSYIAAADVLALSSDSVESFGMVLIEAMACGRAVIATDLPGVRDVVAPERDGLLVPPGDVAALAKAVARISQMTPADRRAMGASGRRKVETRFGWERVGDRLDELYAEVVGKRSSGVPVDLPVDVRAAIALAVVHCGGLAGAIGGRVIGQERLIAEIARYASIDGVDSNRLIALGAQPGDLQQAVATSTPDEVVAVVAGSLERFLWPLRAAVRESDPLPRDLPRGIWRRLGYERVGVDGIQGLASLGWAVGERIGRRISRPDLADRCRIAMLRSLVTATPPTLAAIRLHRYRRVRQ
jgi:glycosyltransferase involved in cell wall biosynthesis